MKPHPTRTLIKSDAADVHVFRGFVVHAVVQIAAHKQDTHVHLKDIIIPYFIIETNTLIWVGVSETGALSKAA